MDSLILNMRYEIDQLQNKMVVMEQPCNWQRNIANCMWETKTENSNKAGENFVAMLPHCQTPICSETHRLDYLLWTIEPFLFISINGCLLF